MTTGISCRQKVVLHWLLATLLLFGGIGSGVRTWANDAAPIVVTPVTGVVLVVIDDIGYGDINWYSPSDLKTPHLDRLAQESVRLTDFHVGTTCSPTRASLLTGRHVNATGVWHTIAGRSQLREDELTIADVFQANGWRTGVFGKWHLGEGQPFAPRFRGFDKAVIHGGGGVGQQPDYWRNDYYASSGQTLNHAGEATEDDHYLHNGISVKADEFCTDYFFSNAFAFMDEAIEATAPFFCYIPTNAAHGPFNAPVGGKPGFDGLIENVDHNMGRLEDFLADRGVRDDVLVIFTTDNGTAGQHRMGGLRGKKGSHYDGGHNVPCLMRWPNGGLAGTLAAVQEIAGLTAAADLFPTLVELFSLTVPAGGQTIHGKSLGSMLRQPGQNVAPRNWVVDTQRSNDLVKWKKLCVMQDEVLEGKIAHKWRLTRANSESPWELYDWLTDRAQAKDLATQHPEIVRQLTEVYESWWQLIDRQTRAYPPTLLGNMEESILYSHDWIGKGGAPWHQNHVLNGAAGSRVNSVRFTQPGRYQFDLRRWPREDNGAIDETDSAGRGTALPIAKARLVIAGVGSGSVDVAPGDVQAILELDVPSAMETTLETAFLDQQDEILAGAYYVYIRRIDDAKE